VGFKNLEGIDLIKNNDKLQYKGKRKD